MSIHEHLVVRASCFDSDSRALMFDFTAVPLAFVRPLSPEFLG